MKNYTMSASKEFNNKGANIFIGSCCLIFLVWLFWSKDKPDPITEAISKQPTTKQIAACGERMAMRVIRAKCKDPESVKFLEKVAEQYYPESGVYVTKFLITATNSFGGRVKGYGVASVHYSGNDPYKSENWQLNNASIEE